jgi:hypothetical protein
MSKRRIKHVRLGRCSVSIHRDREWEEFVVTTKAPGDAAGTYHTTDKQDARSSAAYQIRYLRRLGVCKA